MTALSLPVEVARVGQIAGDLGWRVAYTFHEGPPTSVSLVATRDGERLRGIWPLGALNIGDLDGFAARLGAQVAA